MVDFAGYITTKDQYAESESLYNITKICAKTDKMIVVKVDSNYMFSGPRKFFVLKLSKYRIFFF